MSDRHSSSDIQTNTGTSSSTGQTVSTSTGIFGSIFKSIGQIKANKDEAREHLANAESLRAERKLGQFEQTRKMNIFNRKITDFGAQQVSGYARAGVDLSGSALAVVAQTKADAVGERIGLQRQFKGKQDRLRLEEHKSRKRAGQLNDTGNNTLLMLGNLFGGSIV
jgi:hypothetical protein